MIRKNRKIFLRGNEINPKNFHNNLGELFRPGTSDKKKIYKCLGTNYNSFLAPLKI